MPGNSSENIYPYYPALGRKEKKDQSYVQIRVVIVRISDELWLEVEVECRVIVVKRFIVTFQR